MLAALPKLGAGGGAAGDGHRDEAVGVDDEADVGALELAVGGRPDGGAAGAHAGGVGEGHADAVAPLGDLLGIDVQLHVAVAVDPQGLAGELVALEVRHRQHARQQGRRVDDLPELCSLALRKFVAIVTQNAQSHDRQQTVLEALRSVADLPVTDVGDVVDPWAQSPGEEPSC